MAWHTSPAGTSAALCQHFASTLPAHCKHASELCTRGTLALRACNMREHMRRGHMHMAHASRHTAAEAQRRHAMASAGRAKKSYVPLLVHMLCASP